MDAVGETQRKHDGKYSARIGQERETFERPRGKDISTQQVVDLRRMLSNAGYDISRSSNGVRTTTDSSNPVDLGGKRAVVALDYRGARIYALDAPTHSSPEELTAPDPWHLNHHLHHRKQDKTVSYDLDEMSTTEFFKSLASELQPASEVLLLGHGKGKSNASHLFESYVEKHRRDIASKIVASVRCDVDDITDNQLLRLGETYFGEDVPERDYPDSRRGEPRPGETQKHTGT